MKICIPHDTIYNRCYQLAAEDTKEKKKSIAIQLINHHPPENATAEPRPTTSQSYEPKPPSIDVIGAETTAADVTTTESDVTDLRPDHICSLQKFQRMKVMA